MSGNNLQIVQQAYSDFSQGNLAGVLAVFADDIQWITPGSTTLAGERRGKTEVADFFRLLLEQWEFLDFSPREYVVSGDRVIVLGRYEVRSRQTHRIAASHWAMVWTFREGKATHFQEYVDTAALEAAQAT